MSRAVEKGIAEALRQAAVHWPDEPDWSRGKAEFCFGSLTIRCKPSRPAIEAVANKFERGYGTHGPLCLRPYTMAEAWQSLRVVGPYDWRRT